MSVEDRSLISNTQYTTHSSVVDNAIDRTSFRLRYPYGLFTQLHTLKVLNFMLYNIGDNHELHPLGSILFHLSYTVITKDAPLDLFVRSQYATHPRLLYYSATDAKSFIRCAANLFR